MHHLGDGCLLLGRRTADHAPQQLGSGRTVGRFLAQGTDDKRPKRRVKPLQPWFLPRHPVEHGLCGTLAERAATGPGEGHRPAPREDVGRSRYHPTTDLLGCHERRSAQTAQVLAHPCRSIHRPGNPEIDHSWAEL